MLDHGRGRWPYSIRWNWGAGSGHVDGAVLVGAKLFKVSEELDWRYDEDDPLAPWRITGESLDLEFTPFHDHVSSTNLGVISTRGHQCFGHYAGWITAGDRRIEVSGLVGWAEDVRNRW